MNVCLVGLHSLRKSQRFTVNMSFVPYKIGFLTVNLHISRAWRLPLPNPSCNIARILDVNRRLQKLGIGLLLRDN
jgi:hypothetical protein